MAADGSKAERFLQQSISDVSRRYRELTGNRLNSDQEESLYFWLEDNLALADFQTPEEED